MPHVTVIIVNWQRARDTIECVQSVQQSEHTDIRILVVDNGSQDDSVLRLQKSLPSVELLSLSENLGFAGGYNTGIHYALEHNTDFLFLLNNDTVIEPDTISQMLAAPWDVVVPKILYFDAPDTIWAAGARWRRFPPSVKMIGHREADSKKYQVPQALDYATGCALLLRKQVAEVTGGFDPLYQNYMEDYDFFYRLRKAGFNAGYAPKARVLHKVSQTLGTGSTLVWRYTGRNTVLFYRQGNRFPRRALGTYLAWVTVREMLKGNFKSLPPFWNGVRDGLRILGKEHV